MQRPEPEGLQEYDALYLLGERGYGRHDTPREGLSCVTTRWSEMTIPPGYALLDAARNAP